jgi:HK97 gp10 family phage protein
MTKSRLDLKGFDEYLAKVARAGVDIDPVCDEALSAGGAILLDGMKRRVPKDTHNLENHLTCTDPVQDGTVHYVEVGISQDADANTARYGNVQEFGSAHTPAQPYVRPTFDQDLGKARAAMRKVFEEKKLI